MSQKLAHRHPIYHPYLSIRVSSSYESSVEGLDLQANLGVFSKR